MKLRAELSASHRVGSFCCGKIQAVASSYFDIADGISGIRSNTE
jgi:hypothetical protein